MTAAERSFASYDVIESDGSETLDAIIDESSAPNREIRDTWLGDRPDLLHTANHLFEQITRD